MLRKLQELRCQGLDPFDLCQWREHRGSNLAANWSDGVEVALGRLDTYLRTKSIAVGAVIGGILDPFESRWTSLAESYERTFLARSGSPPCRLVRGFI